MEPRHRVLNIIRNEHRALAAVLHGLRFMMRQIRERGGSHAATEQEFAVLRAMLHYIDAFPEQEHHPKEDRYLFSRIRSSTREGDAVLDDLESEHRLGGDMIRHLEQGLLRFEEGGAAYLAAFATAVEAYCDFHWQHMRKEEDIMLPLAERTLTAADWAQLDLEFGKNAYPLDAADFRHPDQREDFDKLFSRIVQLAPPPIGVGGSG
jgi:hemerythrin-like domain-containing protein